MPALSESADAQKGELEKGEGNEKRREEISHSKATSTGGPTQPTKQPDKEARWRQGAEEYPRMHCLLENAYSKYHILIGTLILSYIYVEDHIAWHIDCHIDHS